MNKKKAPVILPALLTCLAAAVLLGFTLWTRRPTSAGDPGRLYEDETVSAQTRGIDPPPVSSADESSETGPDFDVRDYEDGDSGAYVVGKTVTYGRKESTE